MSITIEEGKSYRAADGERWTNPCREETEAGYSWRLDDAHGTDFSFCADGRFWADGEPCGHDLVAEWRLEPGDPVCDLGKHYRGPNDICTICGATPEQVNEQARGWVADAIYVAGENMTATPDDNPKTAIGQAKPPMHAIPPVALLHLGAAMENGEGKYGLFNWRDHAVSSTIYYDAALRHLMAWWDGENIAADSGVHHLAHVMACCAILLDAQEAGKLNDNRGRLGAFSEVAQRMHDERLAKNNSA